jgi:hypothetical protein
MNARDFFDVWSNGKELPAPSRDLEDHFIDFAETLSDYRADQLSSLTIKDEEFKEDYLLVPMSEIDDEARALAVSWLDADLSSAPVPFIAQKHKLASDLMNYARRKRQQELEATLWGKTITGTFAALEDATRELLEAIKTHALAGRVAEAIELINENLRK